MGEHGEGSDDSDSGIEMDHPNHPTLPVSKEACICGIAALILVITSVGLLLWRMSANQQPKQERADVPEGPEQLNDAAWRVVRERRASPEEYARALEQSVAAVRGAPENGNILNTLGVAQYRTGRYADALATLTKSEKMNATTDGSHPADLAFLAMAQHVLGRKKEAQETLERLHDVMKNLRWFKDPEARGFLREAEETLKGNPSRETTKDTKDTKKEVQWWRLSIKRRAIVYWERVLKSTRIKAAGFWRRCIRSAWRLNSSCKVFCSCHKRNCSCLIRVGRWSRNTSPISFALTRSS